MTKMLRRPWCGVLIHNYFISGDIKMLKKQKSWEEDCLIEEYLIVESQTYDNSNGRLIFDVRNRVSTIVSKFYEKVLYKNCTFKNVYFRNARLKDISFIECKFERCIFENCKIAFDSRVVFENCFLHTSKFIGCNFIDVLIFRSVLKNIEFIDTNLSNSILYNNCYYSTSFIDGCDISGMFLYKTTVWWRMEFIENNKSYTKANLNTVIGDFDYKNKYNIDIPNKVYSIRTREDDVARTFFNIETLFKQNNIPPWHSECFYKSRLAKQKASRGLDWLKLYISKIVCGYGERPFNALIFSIFIILIFSFIYMVVGFSYSGQEIKYVLDISKNCDNGILINDFLKSFYFSYISFVTVGFGETMPVDILSKVFLCLEITLGVTMIAVFTSTLVKKMTR